jgi:hypothetical protein
MKPFARLREIHLRRPWWYQWLRRLGYALLLAVVAGGIRYVYRHHKVTTQLQEALDELDRTDPGWRLQDIEAAREVIPDDENSAACVREVARLLPPGWPPKPVDDALQHLDPPARLRADQYATLCETLDAVKPARDEARKLAQLPRGRHRIVYLRNVMNTMLKDQQDVRVAVRLLVFDALQCAEEGDLSAAVTACRAALHAARSIGDEPLFLTQLVRVACVAIACDSLERVLAQGEPDPVELAGLQRLFEQEEAFRGLRIAVRGERAFQHEMFDALETGDVRMSQFAGNDRTPPSFEERFLGWYIQDNFRAEHPLLLSLLSRRLAELDLPSQDQEQAERAFVEEVRALPRDAVLARLLLPTVYQVGEVFRRRDAYLRCMAATLAAERYRRAQGDWPASLEQLAPLWIAAVPADPYDGKPLRYRRLEDGVVVYSVGRDREDNGGTLDRADRIRPGTDLGYRLWDVKHRRQPPAAPPVQPPGANQ